MSDRELLELAAKAAGQLGSVDRQGYFRIHTGGGLFRLWNPLTDDGDALRLAVKLRLSVDLTPNRGPYVDDGHAGYEEPWGTDPYAATRRAIVRAAAAAAIRSRQSELP